MLLTLDTLVIGLHKLDVANLSLAMCRKLATGLASVSNKSDVEDVTVGDLLNYFPARYEDRSNFLPIERLEDNLEAAVEMHVKVAGGVQVGRNRHPKAQPLFLFEISGANAANSVKPVVVKWFVSGRNAKQIVTWYGERFTQGTRFVAYGRWEWDKQRQTHVLMVNKPDELEILSGPGSTDADLEKIEPDEDRLDPTLATIHTGRVPVYRKLGPFMTKRLREIIHSVLAALEPKTVEDPLPDDLKKSLDLVPSFQAIKEIHFPPEGAKVSDYEMFRSPAQRRLIFDEFFWLSFAMQMLRGERQKEPKGTVIEIPDSTKERLKALLPFPLTGAQKRVIGEIFSDLKSDAPMNRLIQGDVGSGKTIVAFLAMFAAMENGYQTTLMAPTEILAEQHFRNASRIFEGTGYRVELLTGSRKTAAKKKVYEALAAGDVHMIVGTHAIIQEDVKFDRLGLAVVDEQHRFGVMQRAQLKAAGQNTDILVMTATPIPRSLAMTVYGDLDVSVIDEMPPGRTPIKTVVCGEDQRDGVYRGIEREVQLGRQAYVVYPLIEESAKVDLKAATKMYEDLRTKIFPQYNVGLLHGKLKSVEKEEIMAGFVAGKIDILVSTTVIEVGVDVPNASLMVIEHAERFGLSQLHQLRGRVGRGCEQSYCVLLAGFKKTAVAKERLGIMEQTSDGFKIAEKDLEIRGQGEILGTRQSGLQGFNLANIVRDLDILIEAKKAAEEYLTKKRTSKETAAMVKNVLSDNNVGLASVG